MADLEEEELETEMKRAWGSERAASLSARVQSPKTDRFTGGQVPDDDSLGEMQNTEFMSTKSPDTDPFEEMQRPESRKKSDSGLFLEMERPAPGPVAAGLFAGMKRPEAHPVSEMPGPRPITGFPSRPEARPISGMPRPAARADKQEADPLAWKQRPGRAPIISRIDSGSLGSTETRGTSVSQGPVM